MNSAYVCRSVVRDEESHPASVASVYTRESQKLSALLFFQFIYTKVGVEQVRHFST
jgi:hypothetical protein